MRIYVQSCVDSLRSESEVSSCQGLRWSTEFCSPRRQSQGHGVVTRTCLSGKSTLCDDKKRIHRITIVKCYRRSKLLLLVLPLYVHGIAHDVRNAHALDAIHILIINISVRVPICVAKRLDKVRPVRVTYEKCADSTLLEVKYVYSESVWSIR